MKFSKRDAKIIEKHGIKLWVYQETTKIASTVYIEVTEGHFEEFYHEESTFIYYVIAGTGTFFLDGKATPVIAGDLLTIPPKTKIYYLGAMKMVLTTTPAWREELEHHVKFIERSK